MQSSELYFLRHIAVQLYPCVVRAAVTQQLIPDSIKVHARSHTATPCPATDTTDHLTADSAVSTPSKAGPHLVDFSSLWVCHCRCVGLQHNLSVHDEVEGVLARLRR